jgi:hypothetical protein
LCFCLQEGGSPRAAAEEAATPPEGAAVVTLGDLDDEDEMEEELLDELHSTRRTNNNVIDAKEPKGILEPAHKQAQQNCIVRAVRLVSASLRFDNLIFCIFI